MKINKKKKVIGRFLISGFFVIFLCSLVIGLQISSIYGQEKNLEMSPGESKDVIIDLKSYQTEGDIIIKAEITQGSEIAMLIDGPEYSVSSEEFIATTLKVQIPEDTELGTEYLIGVKYFNVAPPASEEQVPLTVSLVKTINVLVIEEPTEIKGEGISTTWMILGIVLIAIVIALIWFVVKNKKEVLAK